MGRQKWPMSGTREETSPSSITNLSVNLSFKWKEQIPWKKQISPKFTQQEIRNLNDPNTVTELWSKTLQTKKIPGTDGFISEFYKICEEEIIQTLNKFFHNTEVEGILPSSFYEASINLILKPEKDIIGEENYRQKYSLWTDIIFLNKNLAKRIQQHIKRIKHNQMGFIPGMQPWFQNRYNSLH